MLQMWKFLMWRSSCTLRACDGPDRKEGYQERKILPGQMERLEDTIDEKKILFSSKEEILKM
jgi:hypothetical protein